MLALYIINKYDRNQKTLLADHSYYIGNWLRMSLKKSVCTQNWEHFFPFFFSGIVQIFKNITEQLLWFCKMSAIPEWLFSRLWKVLTGFLICNSRKVPQMIFFGMILSQ